MQKLMKYIGWLVQPISNNSAFFVFLYALGAICATVEAPLTEDVYAYPLRYLELFLDLYVLCCLLSLLPRRLRRVVRAVLYVFFYAVAIVEVYCFHQFQTVFTPTILMLMQETNVGEARDFFTGYLSADVLRSPVGYLLLLMAVHVGWSCIRPHLHLPRLNRQLMLPLRFIGGLTVAVLLGWCCQACWENKQKLWNTYTAETTGEMELAWNNDRGQGFYMPVYRLLFAWRVNRLAVKQVSTLRNDIKELRVDSCSFPVDNIVLIIGESYNRQHSQLYGYPLPTTPRQQWRREQGELTVLDDVVTPWNVTSNAFKHLFSLYTSGDEGSWSDYPLVTELFHKAGYHVCFLTNQFVQDAQTDVFDFSGGFFLNDPILSKAQFDSRNQHKHRYDNGLLAEYDSLKHTNDSHNFIIFHLIGQHMDYRHRYPKQMSHFRIDDYSRRAGLSADDQRIVSRYDNATLYNDSIVDAIIQRFEGTNSVVIYVADHGEECFDELHRYGRVHARPTPATARQEFRVPMWIWTSAPYREAHPYATGRIRQAAPLRYASERLPHTLLSLGGIHCPYYQKRYDILSPDYDATEPRLLENTIDYDSLQNVHIATQP